jgi:hypothetical protein
MNYLTVILLPVLAAILVIKGVNWYSTKSFSPLGVSPSYFTSIALLFALFSSLVFGELWIRVSKVNDTLLLQANSLRGILRITETDPTLQPLYADKVKQFIQEAIKNENRLINALSTDDKMSFLSNKIIAPLYKPTADTALFKKRSEIQHILFQHLETLRMNWFTRYELINQRILPEKMIVLLLMGFFTQVAVAFSHIGNKKAVRDTVILFTLAFMCALIILNVIDNSALMHHFTSIAVLSDVY